LIDPNSINAGPQFRQAQQSQLAPAPTAPQFVDHPAQTGLMNTPISKTRTFQFRFESQLEGQVYEGTFTCRKLSVRDLAQMGVRKVQLNGGFHYDSANPGCGVEGYVDDMNSMIAHLELALVQAPFWFKLEEICDPQLLTEIYQKVVEFENSFFRRPGGEVQPGHVGTNAGGTESKEPSSSGSVTPLGRGQVPSTLEP
jgi:hypothetical protein